MSVSARQTPTCYQVYGERCSGTHFVIKLLERNVADASFTEDYGFKHWFGPGADAFDPACVVIIVAREPVRWAQSFHRKPWHAAPHLKDMSFSDFIRAEWVGGTDEDGVFEEHNRERNPITGERFRNIWALREAKLAQWSALKIDHPVLYVDYGQAAADPEGFIDRTCRRFGWQRRADFRPIESYKGLGAETYEPKPYDPVSDEDSAFITSQINTDLERKWFGRTS